MTLRLAAAMFLLAAGSAACDRRVAFTLPDTIVRVAAVSVADGRVVASSGLLSPDAAFEARRTANGVETWVLGYDQTALDALELPDETTLASSPLEAAMEPRCRRRFPAPAFASRLADDGTIGAGEPYAGPELAPRWAPDVCDGVEQISMGDNHTCVRLGSGDVWCVGGNDRGQLGIGILGDLATPEKVMLPAPAVDLSAGLDHTCAVLASGEVACFGDARNARLGSILDGIEVAPAPRLVPNLDDVVQVSSGGAFTCVRSRSRGVICFGINNYRQLGLPDARALKVEPRVIEGLGDDVVEVSAGFAHACARHADGGVSCWGGDDGIGRAERGNSHVPERVPGIEHAVRVVAGYLGSCALEANGVLSCWGSTAYAPSRTPAPVPELSAVTDFELSRSTLCAFVAGDERPHCLGENHGQLGDRVPAESTVPVIGPPLDGRRHFALGRYAACYAGAEDRVRCWGSNQRGQLGIGRGQAHGVPVKVQGLPVRATAVDVGSFHACALGEDRRAYCWGRNDRGQLGLAPLARTGPDEKVPIAGLEDVVEIAAGHTHTCFRRSDATVACVGHHQFGQLGDGRPRDAARSETTPVEVPTAANATRIEAGRFMSCVLIDRNVYCWGIETQTSAVRAVNLTDAVDLAVGDHHACAVTATGRVHCWWNSEFGQVGAPRGRYDDVEVADIDDAVDVECGEDSTCIRRANGDVLCMGWIVDPEGTAVPTRMDVPPATALALGLNHGCLLDAAGVVTCFGAISTYHAGGENTGRISQTIDGLVGVERISSGESLSCALKNGAVDCWGWNDVAQLGVREPALYFEPKVMTGLP